MLFDYSVSDRGTARTPRALWALIGGALAAYVAGALLRALGPGELLDDIAGFALVLLGFLLACLVTASSVARLAGEEESHLDEYERDLMRQTLASAYRKIGGLIFLLAVYADFGPDFGWWVPQPEQWVGVLFFLLLTWMLLPTALLLRRLPPEDVVAEFEEQAR